MLLAGWHADHVTPVRAGGQTEAVHLVLRRHAWLVTELTRGSMSPKV